MAVTNLTAKQISDTRWRVTWGSTLASPTYYVYRDGLLMMQTRQESYEFDAARGEQVQIDVLDDMDDAPTEVYPGKMILSWEPVDGANHYRIDEKIRGTWTERARIQETGLPFYWYQTRWLDDMTAYQWRVVAVTEGGVDGLERPLTAVMVRRPDVPELGWTWVSFDDGIILSTTT